MHQVTIYTTPTCQFSRQLREFLWDHHVLFTEYNVAEEYDRLMDMKQYTHGASTVPVIIINKGTPDQKVLIGFESVILDSIFSKA